LHVEINLTFCFVSVSLKIPLAAQALEEQTTVAAAQQAELEDAMDKVRTQLTAQIDEIQSRVEHLTSEVSLSETE